MVKYALDEDDVGGVGTAHDDVGHDGDADVFFDGEGAGVERPSVPERVELLFGEDTREDVTCWKGDELDHDAGDENRRI